MKILITGGAGFIGSAVVRNAVQRGLSVVNLDKLTYAANLDNLKAVESNPFYFFEQADICDRSRLDDIFAKHEPDLVLNLAAESHVDRSIDGPDEFIKTNILGTFNLLEASRIYWEKKGLPSHFKFHHVSTDEVFGSLNFNSESKFDENSPYDPSSPYAASKASSDQLVGAWQKTYGLPTILTNCSNNYGPFHFPEKLIPVVILSALHRRPINVYGDGQNVRDWLFVEDHADALLKVLEFGKAPSRYNIGGESEITNIDLVKMICGILDNKKPNLKGSSTDLIKFVADRPGHDFRYAIDPTKITNELGWRPSLSLERGLELTVEWYIQNEEWWAPLITNGALGQRLGRFER